MVASLALTPITAKSRILPDSEIRQILVDRIDAQRQGVGIVVGIIEPQGRRLIVYGKADDNDHRPLDGDTVFEIGSVTKVFTSLLLADMVQRGEVAGLWTASDQYGPESRLWRGYSQAEELEVVG